MSPTHSIIGIITAVAPRAERFTRWEVFTRTEGFVGVTVPQKMGLPFGLFDQVELQGTVKGKGFFAKEIHLIERPTALAKKFDALEEASSLAKTMTSAFRHLPDYAPVYDVFIKALAHYAAHKGQPKLVTFKALYKMLQAEGFPVKEDWLERLPESLRTAAIEALKAEVGGAADFDNKLQESLERWMREELGMKA